MLKSLDISTLIESLEDIINSSLGVHEELENVLKSSVNTPPNHVRIKTAPELKCDPNLKYATINAVRILLLL